MAVCSREGLQRVAGLQTQWPWSFVGRWVEGGAHRQDSVYAGLCAPDRCPAGQETATGQLCVGPTQAGAPAHFTVAPKGCFSGSCHKYAHAGCAVVDEGASLRLDSLLCIAPVTEAFPCINDCSGIGTAGCDSGPLAPGTYTARLGGLSVNFQVPGDIPVCVTSP